jgi:hypothetical protein
MFIHINIRNAHSCPFPELDPISVGNESVAHNNLLFLKDNVELWNSMIAAMYLIILSDLYVDKALTTIARILRSHDSLDC